MASDNSSTDITTKILVPGVNKTVRIVVKLDDTFRPLLWVQVGPDGSVYLGPRMEISSLRGVAKKPNNKKVSFHYDEVKDIVDPSTLGDFHVSFHPSGAINIAHERLYRTRWERLDTAHQLCLIMFAHPKSYETVDVLRKRDILLDDIVHETQPLHAKIIVRRLEQKQVNVVPSMSRQRNLVLEYSGLSKTVDFFVQIAVGYGITGPWPKAMGIAFSSSTNLGKLGMV